MGNRRVLWLLLLATIPAWAPLTYPGWLVWQQGYLPYFNLHDLLRSPGLTWAPPFTLTPDVRWGPGPFPYLVAGSLHLLGFSPAQAVRAMVILALLLGTTGVFLWLRQVWGAWSALVGALVWLYAPYTLQAALQRGAVAELWLWALTPWVLWGAAAPLSVVRWAAGLALMAALWSQVGMATALMALAVIGFVAGKGWHLTRLRKARFTLKTDFRFRHWLPFLVGAVVGLAGVVVGWRVMSGRPFPYAAEGVPLYRVLWYGREGGTVTALSAVGLGLLGLGVTVGWGNSTIQWPWRWLLLLAVGVALAWPPGASVGAWLGVDRLVLTPRQWLGLATLATAPLAAWATARLRLARPVPALLAVSLAVVSTVPQAQPAYLSYLPGPRPRAVFGAYDLVLLDAQVDAAPAPGQEVHVTAHWQALRPQTTDWTVFVQVLDSANQIRGQRDTQPHGGAYPTTRWRPGEVVTDTYTVTVASDAPAHNLRLIMGLYDWQTLQRLPVQAGGDFVAVDPYP